MTPDIVTEARRLLDAATPGPWEVGEWHDIIHQTGRTLPTLVASMFRRQDQDRLGADAAFIAAAPRLVTELVAEVERLRTALDQRTDRELAARLLDFPGVAFRYEDTVYDEIEHGDQRDQYLADISAAACLLGGDQ